MAKSNRAKMEKKKDFQKAKLKVGKTKAKSENFTNTSFKARSISVLQSSLHTNAPSSRETFNHHLGLLNHKSEGQRKESLAYLTSVLSVEDGANGNNEKSTATLPQPAAIIISKCQPLIRDPSLGVRIQVLKLLRCLPESDIKAHIEGLLLWVRLGMTNLSAPVRLGALDVLEWLIEIASEEVVSCAGGWSKTLKCFAGILGWDAPPAIGAAKTAWTSTPSTTTKGATDSKLLLRTLTVLTSFMHVGLIPPTVSEADEKREARVAADTFPLWQMAQHTLSMKQVSSNPFGYLDLFGAPKDDEGMGYEGCEERSSYFDKNWRGSFEQGLDKVVKEGGGVGRAAVGLTKVMASALQSVGNAQ